MEAYGPIGELLARVRGRWQAIRVLKATVRVALGASTVLLVLAGLAHWADRSPVALAVLGALSLPVFVAAVAWALMPLRRGPSDSQLARFIEERVPALDDRLVTAVEVMRRLAIRPAAAGFFGGPVEAGRYVRRDGDARADGRAESPLAAPMLADAATRAVAIDLESIVPAAALRRSGLHAIGAVLALAIVASIAISPARQALDQASLLLFPSRVTLDVRPGDVRIEAGMPLAIEARLAGTRAPIPVEVQIADGELWRRAAMNRVSDTAFRLPLELVTAPFRYRVAAGSLVSPTYAVTLARAPRVARIDLDYTYPASLSLNPRSEEDSGDIYAPGGTDVRVRIHTDGPVVNGRLTLGNGKSIELRAEAPTRLSASLRIVEDNSYRVALLDGEGLSSPGETEYFIRVLEDRPPEVHLTKPAGDRSVTRLQEIEIEAQADDDYGVDRLELVYSVRGAAEHVVPFDVPRHATSVTARRTLYLEDLDVQPGDFVSYYVRARDLTRGTRSSETRSDIFFLDVKPFEQEFSLAQSQSMAGSGYSGAIDELVNGQRQVVVATWKIERRATTANGARSERDVRSVARTQSDLRQRAERTASSFRESTMRDPRKRGISPASQAPAEEDAMAAAVGAMDRAVVALEALKTREALPPEMEALNQLLKAQTEIKHRQVALNAAGAGNANRNFDISTLFDQELRRQQQTNYETSKGAGKRPDPESSALDAIKDLARRQDELLRRQQDLARAPVPDDERKRQLEQLTREQSALRQRAEELAQQMSRPQSGQPSSSENARMRDISEDMRQAAGDLRRGAPLQAGSSAGRALEKLRDLEKRLQPSGDDRRRALGEMQLEARQLADRQRQVASELARLEQGDAAKDALRRLAGEQERLLERARQLEDRLKQVARGAPAEGRGGDRSMQAAVQVARDVEQQRLSERMRESADQLRTAAGASSRGLPMPASGPRTRAAAQQDLAKQLDRLADRLADAGRTNDTAKDGVKDGLKEAESRRLSEQLAHAQELREKLDRVGRALETTGRQSRATAAASSEKAPGERGRTGEGRQGAGGTDLSKLSEESLRELREAKDLIDQARREDKSFSQNGAGFTFEGQGMILSAPGTEAFKQDFAKWNILRQQAILALERLESALAGRLRAAASKDRLAAGLDDLAPLAYQKQVDLYFKAIATKKP